MQSVDVPSSSEGDGAFSYPPYGDVSSSNDLNMKHSHDQQAESFVTIELPQQVPQIPQDRAVYDIDSTHNGSDITDSAKKPRLECVSNDTKNDSHDPISSCATLTSSSSSTTSSTIEDDSNLAINDASIQFLMKKNIELRQHIQEMCHSESVQVGELKRCIEKYRKGESTRIQDLEKQVSMYKKQLVDISSRELDRQAIEKLISQLNNVQHSENVKLLGLLRQVQSERQQQLEKPSIESLPFNQASTPTGLQVPQVLSSTIKMTSATNFNDEYASEPNDDEITLPTYTQYQSDKGQQRTSYQNSLLRIRKEIDYLWKKVDSNKDRYPSVGDVTSHDLLKQDLLNLKEELGRAISASTQQQNIEETGDDIRHGDLSNSNFFVSYSDDSDTEANDSENSHHQSIKKEATNPSHTPFRQLKDAPTPMSTDGSNGDDTVRSVRKDLSRIRRVVRGLAKTQQWSSSNGNDEDTIATISTRSIQLLGEQNSPKNHLVEENERLKQKLSTMSRELNKWRIKATILIEKKNLFKKATKENDYLRKKVNTLTEQLEKFCCKKEERCIGDSLGRYKV